MVSDMTGDRDILHDGILYFGISGEEGIPW